MPRGYVWCKYVADDATEWALLVDADHATDTARGWTSVAAGTPGLPQASQPRFVIGQSSTSGRTGTARVATTSCDLWTGATTIFTVEANDNTLDIMTVTEKRQEILRRSR